MKKEYESPEMDVVKLNFDAMMADGLIEQSKAEAGGEVGTEEGEDPFA